MENLIEKYKIDNNKEYLMENDIENIKLPENVQIEITGKNYRLFFRDSIYDSETNNIYLRTRR